MLIVPPPFEDSRPTGGCRRGGAALEISPKNDTIHNMNSGGRFMYYFCGALLVAICFYVLYTAIFADDDLGEK